MRDDNFHPDINNKHEVTHMHIHDGKSIDSLLTEIRKKNSILMHNRNIGTPIDVPLDERTLNLNTVYNITDNASH